MTMCKEPWAPLVRSGEEEKAQKRGAHAPLIALGWSRGSTDLAVTFQERRPYRPPIWVFILRRYIRVHGSLTPAISRQGVPKAWPSDGEGQVHAGANRGRRW